MFSDPNGCYYNFEHYNEGERIITNEPCLNCTCRNRIFMCYLRVCPFTKEIGQNCTIEKVPGQCCPIITCPEGGYHSALLSYNYLWIFSTCVLALFLQFRFTCWLVQQPNIREVTKYQEHTTDTRELP